MIGSNARTRSESGIASCPVGRTATIVASTFSQILVLSLFRRRPGGRWKTIVDRSEVHPTCSSIGSTIVASHMQATMLTSNVSLLIISRNSFTSFSPSLSLPRMTLAQLRAASPQADVPTPPTPPYWLRPANDTTCSDRSCSTAASGPSMARLSDPGDSRATMTGGAGSRWKAMMAEESLAKDDAQAAGVSQRDRLPRCRLRIETAE